MVNCLDDHCLLIIYTYLDLLDIHQKTRSISKHWNTFYKKYIPHNLFGQTWFKVWLADRSIYKYTQIDFKTNKRKLTSELFNYDPWIERLLLDVSKISNPTQFQWFRSRYFVLKSFENRANRCLIYAVKGNNKELITYLINKYQIYNIARAVVETIYTNNLPLFTYFLNNFQFIDYTSIIIIAEIYNRTDFLNLLNLLTNIKN